MFMKGSIEPKPKNEFGLCWDATITVSPARAAVGDQVLVTVEITGLNNPECLCWPCCDLGGHCPYNCIMLRQPRELGSCCADEPCCLPCPPAPEPDVTTTPTPAPSWAQSAGSPPPPTKPRDDKQTPNTGHRGTPNRRGSERQSFEGQAIELSLFGEATFPRPRSPGPIFKTNQRSGTPGQLTVYTGFPNVNNQLYVPVTVLGPGPITVAISRISGSPVFIPTGVIFNQAEAPAPPPIGSPVAKLQLSPAKSYRHCDDTITLSALAVDVNGAPVANATVTFAAYGDCVPSNKQISAVTDASGIAIITMWSEEPGAVSVVAATVNTQGFPVLSQPALTHILGSLPDYCCTSCGSECTHC